MFIVQNTREAPPLRKQTNFGLDQEGDAMGQIVHHIAFGRTRPFAKVTLAKCYGIGPILDEALRVRSGSRKPRVAALLFARGLLTVFGAFVALELTLMKRA